MGWGLVRIASLFPNRHTFGSSYYQSRSSWLLVLEVCCDFELLVRKFSVQVESHFAQTLRNSNKNSFSIILRRSIDKSFLSSFSGRVFRHPDFVCFCLLVLRTFLLLCFFPFKIVFPRTRLCILIFCLDSIFPFKFPLTGTSASDQMKSTFDKANIFWGFPFFSYHKENQFIFMLLQVDHMLFIFFREAFAFATAFP